MNSLPIPIELRAAAGQPAASGTAALSELSLTLPQNEYDLQAQAAVLLAAEVQAQVEQMLAKHPMLHDTVGPVFAALAEQDEDKALDAALAHRDAHPVFPPIGTGPVLPLPNPLQARQQAQGTIDITLSAHDAVAAALKAADSMMTALSVAATAPLTGSVGADHQVASSKPQTAGATGNQRLSTSTKAGPQRGAKAQTGYTTLGYVPSGEPESTSVAVVPMTDSTVVKSGTGRSSAASKPPSVVRSNSAAALRSAPVSVTRTPTLSGRLPGPPSTAGSTGAAAGILTGSNTAMKEADRHLSRGLKSVPVVGPTPFRVGNANGTLVSVKPLIAPMSTSRSHSSERPMSVDRKNVFTRNLPIMNDAQRTAADKLNALLKHMEIAGGSHKKLPAV